MADDEIYTIEADIPEVRTQDAYLNSYRAYTGPQDGSFGVPLGNLPIRKFNESDANTMRSQFSESSFIRYRPSSNRVLAIVAAFLCFCPVGIAALVYSCRAHFAKKEGKFAKAAILGKSARDLAVASIVLGTALLLIILLIVIIAFVPGIKS